MITRILMFLCAALAVPACDRSTPQEAAARESAREWRVEPKDVTAAALREAATEPDVRAFYEKRGWVPAWTNERVEAFATVLSNADAHALEHVRFLPAAAPDAAAQKEAALTKAALDYAGALARGFVEPNKLWDIYTLPRPQPDLAAGLNAALEGGSVGQWYDSLPPQTEEYRALSAAYRDYRQRAASGPSSDIGGGKLIHAGEKDPRVPAIAEGLQANGYLTGEETGADPQTYTQAMADAVKRLQANYGIQDDGVVGPETLEVLNTGPAERARQLAVNLERRRWLERNPPPTRIEVNTAATLLDYWRDGRHRDRRRVVVGQPDWETPQLRSPIFQLVANPTWTVPESIEEEEIAPKEPGYLARNNMVRRDGHIVQLPGPDNALGQVKFGMKNDHAIYLHDTPAKSLFADSERHRSHGCVRVDDAVGFAQMLAADDGILDAYQEAMPGRDETFIDLNKEVPVLLLYHSAYLDGGGLRLMADAYGWDEDLAAALKLPAQTRWRVKKRTGDIGP